jgi:hypothetical protein
MIPRQDPLKVELAIGQSMDSWKRYSCLGGRISEECPGTAANSLASGLVYIGWNQIAGPGTVQSAAEEFSIFQM